ncbi:MAG: hypothetical protein CVV23_00130 [Ignavibacteriae bacterium HGW-Ignavibacteriae-2]|nr:MAG: hypothetical protein CVV23_00130 [Ignavibacteriae bacterium HGW-Ignavibacteriae-2]
MYPRPLNKLELSALFKLLPGNRPGYAVYRRKIEQNFVIGNGRFGNGNLILGARNDKPDIENSSAPILAAGTVLYDEYKFDIVIHEERYYQIEVDLDEIYKIKIENGLEAELKSWSYSNWLPGQKAPNDNSEIREIPFNGGRFVIAVAPKHKRIWLYDSNDGINHLIPISNFINELLMLKGIKERSNVNIFFEDLFKFTEGEIVSAFINYNRYMKKFIFDEIKVDKPVKQKRNLFSFKKL